MTSPEPEVGDYVIYLDEDDQYVRARVLAATSSPGMVIIEVVEGPNDGRCYEVVAEFLDRAS